MSTNSTIEWTDATWSPATGCDRVSDGCDRCYAMTLARRLKAMGSAKYQNDGDPRTSGPGFGVTMHPAALQLPLKWKKPRRIFVNSMSDLFHKDVSAPFIAQVFAVMAQAPQHQFQILTKRHARMRSLVGDLLDGGQKLIEAAPDEATAQVLYDAPWPLPNVLLGVSVENQQWADIRIPALMETAATTRFLSCEPLLGPVDLSRWLGVEYGETAEIWIPEMFAALNDRVGPAGGLHWVIAGAESGRGARPMDLGWVRTLRDQCEASGTAFFLKQDAVNGKKVPTPKLDGRTWTQMPELAVAR